MPTPCVPEKPTLDGLEERWTRVWADDGTYAFDRTATREQVFVPARAMRPTSRLAAKALR